MSRLRVLNTRPKHQAAGLTKLIETAGGFVFSLPVTDIMDVSFSSADLSAYDHAIFLSTNAVSHFFSQHSKTVLPQSIIAIGPATKAALVSAGVTDVICPRVYNSEGVLSLDVLQNIKDQSIALICGENPRPLLENAFSQSGAQVKKIICYRRVCAIPDMKKIFPVLETKDINTVICTSASSLKNLMYIFRLKAYRDWLLRKTLCVITDKMNTEAKSLGFKSVIQATNATDQAVFDAFL